jgi:hypothetical protein
MISHTNKVLTEAQIIAARLANSQSTHGSIVSNSVGMVILKLRNIYYAATPSKAQLERDYQSCIRSLKQLEDSKAKPAVEFIMRLCDEAIIPELDSVTLYLPSTDAKTEDDEHFSERYLFPLREVLPLVWKAINDHSKYAHHFAGSESEKLTEAKIDFNIRLKSFLNCLERMRTDAVCHHGNRNELVFELNKSYLGVDMIEDAKGTVRAILKDNLNKLFWKSYTAKTLSRAEKTKLIAALFTWMHEDNPLAMFKLLDPTDKIPTSIRTLFMRHGSNPRDINLNETISSALPNLEFSGDPKQYPVLDMINNIFNILEDPHFPQRSEAVLVFQAWIRNTCLLDNHGHVKKITTFYAIYSTHHDYHKHHLLLTSTDRHLDLHIQLISRCDNFFDSIINREVGSVSNEMLLEIKALRQAITDTKKDAMYSEIENFFARYNAVETNIVEMRHIWKLILNTDFQKKVILKDDHIKKFISVFGIFHLIKLIEFFCMPSISSLKRGVKFLKILSKMYYVS